MSSLDVDCLLDSLLLLSDDNLKIVIWLQIVQSFSRNPMIYLPNKRGVINWEETLVCCVGSWKFSFIFQNTKR